MAINPRLDFYRFSLNHKNEELRTFRDFAIEEFKIGKNPSDSKVLEGCLKHFIQSLSTEYAIDKKLKKRICLEKKRSINKHLDKGPKLNSSENTIFGVINGGLFGRDRILANNNNEEDSLPVDIDKTVLQYYFFLIYLPPNHNEGFFMIHSNGKDESITNIFRSYITNIFKGKNFNKANVFEFCPKTFQDEFIKGAVLKSISFKTSFVNNISSADGISSLFNDYDIKIEAVPKNKTLVGEGINRFRRILLPKAFGSKDDRRELGKFDKSTITLENDISNSQKTFEWNAIDNEFSPVVYLKGRIDKTNTDGTPDFEELKDFCSTIFKDEILPEIRPDLYVTRAN